MTMRVYALYRNSRRILIFLVMYLLGTGVVGFVRPSLLCVVACLSTHKQKVGDVLSSFPRLISRDGARASAARFDSECRLPHQYMLFTI